MGKEKLTLYVEGDVKQRAKREMENISKAVTSDLKQRLKVKESGLEERILHVEEELEHVEEEIENLKDERSELKATLRTLKAQKEQEEQPDQEMERFKSVFQKQDWKQPADIADYWSRELDMSKEELWEEVDGSAA